MVLLKSLFLLTALAATSIGQTLSPDIGQIAANAHCSNAQLVHNATIAVGDKLVLFTSLQCEPAAAPAGASVTRRDLWTTWPLCLLCGTCPKLPPPRPPKPTTTKHSTSTSHSKSTSHTSTSTHTSTHTSSSTSSAPSQTPTPPSSPPPTHVCGGKCTTSCNNDAGVLPPTDEDCQTIRDAIAIFQNQGPSSFVVDPNHVETLSFGTCSYFFINTSDKELEYCWIDFNTTAVAASAACFPPVQPFTSEGLCTSPDGLWAVGAAHS